jgi:hypothetical protein
MRAHGPCIGTRPNCTTKASDMCHEAPKSEMYVAAFRIVCERPALTVADAMDDLQLDRELRCECTSPTQRRALEKWRAARHRPPPDPVTVGDDQPRPGPSPMAGEAPA